MFLKERPKANKKNSKDQMYRNHTFSHIALNSLVFVVTCNSFTIYCLKVGNNKGELNIFQEIRFNEGVQDFFGQKAWLKVF